MESRVDRRPLRSIDPNSIRETELHTECRRRRDRESLYSPRHDRERDAARQRAAATRRKETDEARAERLRANQQRIATRRQQETTQAREARCVCIRPALCLSVCFSVLRALVVCKQSLVAIEFSQHRLRSFRLVIASLQIGPTVQRTAQLKHLETTLRTPPAHTRTGCGRTDKDKLRGASARRRRCSSRDAARSCALSTSRAGS